MTSDTVTDEQEAALTKTWRTMGLEDRPVEVARTVTMSTEFCALESTPAELVGRLPRLLQGSETGTNPELRVKGTLGEGGMGLVELAEQLSVGRDVAVKKVRPDNQSERATLVLLREGWTTGLLEHPNIVPIYTLGRDDDDEPVIVMKKIEGTSWLEIIDDPDSAPEVFNFDDPVDLHVEILSQVCNAIHYAHSRGIVHRDLKPENVMLGEFGEVYVLDWGIAVSVDEDPSGRLVSVEEATRPAGTPAYMAPEMVASDEAELGVHTDVFLLGAMLYEALCNKPPYTGDTLYGIMLRAHDCDPPEFDESVDPDLAAICRRAMRRDPEDRFESAASLREALSQFRRSRESSKLAAEGEARLRTVREMIDRERRGEELDDSELYRTFTECRFAFEQAVEIAGDNDRAVDGLQDALETMADRALERDAYKAASLLIADFPRPDEEFGRRLEQLEDDLADRQEDYEELQQIRRDVDVEVGRRSRAFYILAAGAFWSLLWVVLVASIKFELIEVTPFRMVVHMIGLTGAMAGLSYFGRNLFFENEVNRKMINGVVLAFVGATFLRTVGWIAGLDYETILAFEFVLYGVSILILGAATDRRIFVVAPPWLIFAVASAIWPASLVWLFAVGNVLTVGLLAWMWWPNTKCQVGDELSSDKTRSTGSPS